MTNETLCKVHCHNLSVLVHEMCELGIAPVFLTASESRLEGFVALEAQ
jgi:hypothetical protein